MYNDVLQQKLPRKVTPEAFADDIAPIIVRKYLEDIFFSFSITSYIYYEWLDYVGLNLAKRKT